VSAVRPRIKLCGLRTAEQAELAAALDVEFIGLVFAESSKRRVTVEEARRVISGLGTRADHMPPIVHAGIPAAPWFDRCAAGLDLVLSERRPLVVGVFGNQPTALINAVAEAAKLDIVQLSGSGPWEQALEIKRPVIKAVHVQPGWTAEDVLHVCESGTAVMCLLDTGGIPGSEGGTGVPFDWGVASGVTAAMPCLLAGGLTPENVVHAVDQLHPWGVDVSSGIETDGIKDEAKMRAFVNAARRGASEE
jgi:anthranilate synthase/indole-3-glycerol phosphate synthase/phosphoribosylanthranilate isomerase